MLLLMGKVLRWVLGAIASAIFIGAASAMLAEPFWQHLFAKLGIDSSRWVEPITQIFFTSWFRLLCAGVFGSAIGAWVHWAAVLYDRRKPKREADLCDFLLVRIESVISKLERASFSPNPLDGGSIAPVTVVPEILSANNVLAANGFAILEIPTELRQMYLAQNAVYFHSIRPFVASYQLSAARSTAKTCSEAATERLLELRSRQGTGAKAQP